MRQPVALRLRPIWLNTLVARGMPFRDAHEVVGALVRDTVAANRSIAELTLRDLQRYSTNLRSRRDRGAHAGELDARAQADRWSCTGYRAPAAEGTRARMIHQVLRMEHCGCGSTGRG